MKISTHTPHAGCDSQGISLDNSNQISTHTPHAGCDAVCTACRLNPVVISTHTPHVGCDQQGTITQYKYDDFNSHTPCGVRPNYHHHQIYPNRISTHTPHVGCDFLPPYSYGVTIKYFNSHTPCGVRLMNLFYNGFNRDFNSHTPCGVRRRKACRDGKRQKFQLTHPMWGATVIVIKTLKKRKISTHTPHVGCDRVGRNSKNCVDDFNSHTPCGVRQSIVST